MALLHILDKKGILVVHILMKASLFSTITSLLNSKGSRKDRAMFGAIIQQIVLGISLAAPVGPINIEMLKRGIERGFGMPDCWNWWYDCRYFVYASHLLRFIFSVYVYICTSFYVLHRVFLIILFRISKCKTRNFSLEYGI